MKTGKAILGIMAGIATGTALGILFAPESGSDTRRKMVKRSSDLGDAIDKRIESKFEEYESKLDELIQNLSMKIAPTHNDKNITSKNVGVN